MMIQFISAFLATIGYMIIFNVPKKEIPFCATNGGIVWFVYILCMEKNFSIATSTFLAVFLATFISRCLALIRKVPYSVYAIAGILPLVPGAGIYRTMYLVISSNLNGASLKGLETIKIASIIALAILLVLSIPQKFFKILTKAEQY